MEFAGSQGGGQGLRIRVGDHENSTVVGVLHDHGNEPIGTERWRDVCHAAAPEVALMGSPAAAIAAFTSAIAWSRRWKTEAASTASATPSTTARTKSSGPAAPPDPMTGTLTPSVIARRGAA